MVDNNKDDSNQDEGNNELDDKIKDLEDAENEENELPNKEGSDQESNLDYKDMALRAISDLKNYKNRVIKEKDDYVKYSDEKLLIDLLPVLDNLNRASDSVPDNLKNDSWVSGVLNTKKIFDNILEKHSVKKIHLNKGDEFDANMHVCISQDDTVEEGKIASCFEDGFILKDKVLRFAKVSVGSK